MGGHKQDQAAAASASALPVASEGITEATPAKRVLSASTAQGIVTVNCTVAGHALVGVKNKLHVLAEIITGTEEGVKRPTYEVGLVLDKSGSMRGSKIRGVKEACARVVESLSDSDRLHVVAYDSNVDVIAEHARMDSVTRDDVLQRIKHLREGSCTNLSLGLDAMKTLLCPHDVPQKQGLLSKVKGAFRGKTSGAECSSDAPSDLKKIMFVFSDGLVNEGVRDHRQLCDSVGDFFTAGVRTSAFGIGSDFDEEFMKEVAEYGRGDYMFLDRSEHIHKYVERALRGAIAIIGTHGNISLRGSGGAVVTNIYGHDDVVRGAQIGDVREDNHKQVLFEIEVSPESLAANPSLDMILSYKDARAANGFIEIPVRLAVPVTADAALARTTHPEAQKVLVAQAIAETSARDDKVVDLLDAGRVECAIAAKCETVETLSKVSAELPDETGFLSAMLKRAKKTLEKMELRTDTSRMRKCVDYEREMERAMSAASLCYDSSSGGSCDEELPTQTQLARRSFKPVPARRGSCSISDSDEDSDGSDGSSCSYDSLYQPTSPVYSPSSPMPCISRSRSPSPARHVRCDSPVSTLSPMAISPLAQQ